MTENTLMCLSIPKAKDNRRMVTNHENTIAYIEQEVLRAHWKANTPKPARLLVADDVWAEVLPNHYHPYATWRTTDNPMTGWMGSLGIALDFNLADGDIITAKPERKLNKTAKKPVSRTMPKLAGQIDFILTI